ncbi:MAG TPA: hypothetical protein VFZ53_01435 [Polyangiaceae bacterium]
MRDPNQRIPTSHESGARRLAPYGRLRTLLLSYLSPILVDTVLNQAMFKRRLAPQTLTHEELRELAPDIMLGLRLFVAEKRLPDLMVSLAEIIEESGP